MNGAITEPLVSTTSPPNTTIMISTGSSQNFFRARMNRQSSATKSMFVSLFEHDTFEKVVFRFFSDHALELVSHRFGRWSGRSPHDPVAVLVRQPFQAQHILAQHAHDEAGWQNRAVKNKRHHDRVDHLVKQQSELQP